MAYLDFGEHKGAVASFKLSLQSLKIQDVLAVKIFLNISKYIPNLLYVSVIGFDGCYTLNYSMSDLHLLTKHRKQLRIGEFILMLFKVKIKVPL